MGETVKVDDKWRIVLPKKYREGLRRGDQLVVERRGDEIILRKVERDDLVMKFEEIKLRVSRERRNWNAENGKHEFGGFKE